MTNVRKIKHYSKKHFVFRDRMQYTLAQGGPGMKAIGRCYEASRNSRTRREILNSDERKLANAGLL